MRIRYEPVTGGVFNNAEGKKRRSRSSAVAATAMMNSSVGFGERGWKNPTLTRYSVHGAASLCGFLRAAVRAGEEE